MSTETSTPCPQRPFCPCPPSTACTIDQLKACGMAPTSTSDITAILQHPDYVAQSIPQRALLLKSIFGFYVDEEEIGYPVSRLADIIKARLSLKKP